MNSCIFIPTAETFLSVANLRLSEACLADVCPMADWILLDGAFGVTSYDSDVFLKKPLCLII